jgi:inosine-uridine nucleoside N-ribohydrolase
MAQKIIIDTDPGIDDAMAIHLAFADARLEVLGLTTVFGNVWVEQATRNALFLTEQAAHPAVVAEGAGAPLSIIPNLPSHHVHGDEGFGDMAAVTVKTAADPRSAQRYISETCRAYPGEIVLCPVGPLTNIAKLLDDDPEITKFVKKLVIMGGAVGVPGNITDYAEANIWNDPHAADRVFAADWPIELIGLNVTQKVKTTPEDFALLAEKAPIIGQFINEISVFYTKFYESIEGEKVCLMHDPTAIIAVTDPGLFTYETIPLQVITEGEAIGQTIPSDDPARRGVRVAIAANNDKIVKTYLDICGECDKIREYRFSGRLN